MHQLTNWQLDTNESQPNLMGGFIPVGQTCPYRSECEKFKTGNCFHNNQFPAPYACKLIDLRGRFKK